MRGRPPNYPRPEPAVADGEDSESLKFEAPTMEGDESVDAYLARNAPLAARTIVALSTVDRKAAQWVLDHTARDKFSAPIEVTTEDLRTTEGVADVLRLVGVRALRGEAGLTESLKACQVVREVADAMFAQEIASLREAVEKAKSHRLAPVAAHRIEAATGGVVPVEEYKQIIEGAAPVSPSWGRFGGVPVVPVEDAEVAT